MAEQVNVDPEARTAERLKGRLVTASEGENDDLLWGLRGGSSNFGVATSHEFRRHPLGPIVLAGLLVHPTDEAKSLLRASRDFVALKDKCERRMPMPPVGGSRVTSDPRRPARPLAGVHRCA